MGFFGRIPYYPEDTEFWWLRSMDRDPFYDTMRKEEYPERILRILQERNNTVLFLSRPALVQGKAGRLRSRNSLYRNRIRIHRYLQKNARTSMTWRRAPKSILADSKPASSFTFPIQMVDRGEITERGSGRENRISRAINGCCIRPDLRYGKQQVEKNDSSAKRRNKHAKNLIGFLNDRVAPRICLCSERSRCHI